jgi:hypothetical protein
MEAYKTKLMIRLWITLGFIWVLSVAGTPMMGCYIVGAYGLLKFGGRI